MVPARSPRSSSPISNGNPLSPSGSPTRPPSASRNRCRAWRAAARNGCSITASPASSPPSSAHVADIRICRRPSSNSGYMMK
jgi:hypothetical protein